MSGSNVVYIQGGNIYARAATAATSTLVASNTGAGWCSISGNQVFWSNTMGLWTATLGSAETPFVLIARAKTTQSPQAAVAVDGDEIFFATPGQPNSSLKVQVWRGSRTDKDAFPTFLIEGGDSVGDAIVDVRADAMNVYVATSGIASIYRVARAGGPAKRLTITSNEILSMVVRANDIVFSRDSIGIQSVPKTEGAETDLWTPGSRVSFVSTIGGKLFVNLGCGVYDLVTP